MEETLKLRQPLPNKLKLMTKEASAAALKIPLEPCAGAVASMGSYIRKGRQ